MTRKGAGSLNVSLPIVTRLLLHRLQEGALHLRRGAVDLVGQEQVRENRAFMRPELVGPLVEDL